MLFPSHILAAVAALARVAPAIAKPRLLDFRPFQPVLGSPVVCAPHADAAADFLIVGAGLSALAAAHFLEAQTVNCSVVLLEAANIPGGRVRTIASGPFSGLEMGAGWIHDYTNHPMLAVAHWARILTRFVGGNSSYVGGDNIRVFDRGEELEPRLREHSSKLINALLYGIDVHVEGRKFHGRADRPLLQSIHQLTDAFDLPYEDLRLLRWHLDVIFGDWAAPLSDMSLMNMEHGPLAEEGGDCVFPAGFGQVPHALAQGLDVRYGVAVEQVRWAPGKVVAVDAQGKQWSGRKLLVTASIGVLQANDITFAPSLPGWKHNAVDKIRMASLNRVMLRFPYTFWPNTTYTFGFVPEDVADAGDWATAPAYSIAVVAAYEGRQSEEPGATLTFMIGGDSAAAILQQPKEVVVAQLMRLLRQAYGHGVPEPTHTSIVGWAKEPFVLGAYSYLPVGTTAQDDVPLLYRPLNSTLFFAGEATMTGSDRGTTHGAFVSGIREAARMIGRASVVDAIERGDDVVQPREWDADAWDTVADRWFVPESAEEWLRCGPPNERGPEFLLQV